MLLKCNRLEVHESKLMILFCLEVEEQLGVQLITDKGQGKYCLMIQPARETNHLCSPAVIYLLEVITVIMVKMLVFPAIDDYKRDNYFTLNLMDYEICIFLCVKLTNNNAYYCDDNKAFVTAKEKL